MNKSYFFIFLSKILSSTMFILDICWCNQTEMYIVYKNTLKAIYYNR